jgi:hypothetical protein
MTIKAKALMIAVMAAPISACIVPLLPGAAEVRFTQDPAEVSACIYRGNVNGIGGDISTIYVHQMQNQAVSMDADTVFRSGNGGIAYRCKASTPPSQ